MPDLEKGEAFPPSVPSVSDVGSTETTTSSTTSSSLSPLSSSSSPNISNERIRRRKALLTVFGAFLSLLLGFGQMNAFGTYQTWYAAHQLGHMPASTISWIGSLQLWVFFFSGCPIGKIFDTHGPKHLMAAGTLCYITSLMMTSLCKVYYQYILAQGVLFGVGVGLLFYPPLASISTHFSTYRATALGIALAGSSLGGVIYPIMLTNLFQKVGFSWGVRIAGLISAVGLVVATIGVTACPIPRSGGGGGGEGVEGEGAGKEEVGEKAEEKEEEKEKEKPRSVKSLFDTPFLLLAGGSSIAALGLFVPFFYIVDHALHLSPSPHSHTSFYVLAILNAGGVLGRILPSYHADTLGRFNLLFPSALLCGLSCLSLWLIADLKESFGVLIGFGAVYGFCSGAFISLVNPCVVQISEIREVGRRMGLLYTIISFPALVGGPAAGALLSSSHGSYTGMIIFSGCTLVLGSLFILGARLSVERRIFARV